MKLPRRDFLHLAASAAAVPAMPRIVLVQTYPTRPITMIVPVSAGGGTDAIARIAADRMRKSLGQPVIIENVTGADGSLGIGRAARARPDGYTMVLGFIGPNVLNGAFYSLPYDILNDFAPIAPLVTTPVVLFARRTLPGKDMSELIAWLKTNRASIGVAVVDHRLLAAIFKRETGTQITLVPYRGAAPAMQDLATGQIDLFFDAPTFLTLMRAGSIKAYAVTSDKRLPLAPGIPTFAESGLPALSYFEWWGVFAPKGTSKDVIGKLNDAVVEALADPAVQSRLADLGFNVFPPGQQTPDALGARQKADAEKWWPIMRELGIRAE